jgi:hypothetical protein
VGREMEWGKRERAGGRKSKDPIIVWTYEYMK